MEECGLTSSCCAVPALQSRLCDSACVPMDVPAVERSVQPQRTERTLAGDWFGELIIAPHACLCCVWADLKPANPLLRISDALAELPSTLGQSGVAHTELLDLIRDNLDQVDVQPMDCGDLEDLGVNSSFVRTPLPSSRACDTFGALDQPDIGPFFNATPKFTVSDTAATAAAVVFASDQRFLPR